MLFTQFCEQAHNIIIRPGKRITMPDHIISLSAALLYLVAAALQLMSCRRTMSETGSVARKPVPNKAMAAAMFALLLHALGLYGYMVTDTGINLGFYTALSLVSVVIVLLTLIAALRHPIQIMLIVLLPISATTVIINSYTDTRNMVPLDSAGILEFHILTSVIAYSLLALAALQAILLSIQNKLLHHHQTDGILRVMPPLKNMERLLFEIILSGFIVLTISLTSGLLFLENMFAQHVVHKTVLSIFAWFVFLTLLIGHWKLGWRGKTATRWTLSGFVSLMLAYFGSKFVLEIILG